jgi:hypothetical protein
LIITAAGSYRKDAKARSFLIVVRDVTESNEAAEMVESLDLRKRGAWAPIGHVNGVVGFFCPFFEGGGVFWAMVRFESEKCLAEFVNSRSEDAFRRLVAEQSGLVLGMAARRLGGDRSAAEDLVQAILSRWRQVDEAGFLASEFVEWEAE